MKKYVVGDIRGSLVLLQRLLDRIGPTESDTVLFLGSYLGPGGDSRETLDFILKLRAEHPNNFLFLRGCYEFMFCRCIGDQVAWKDAELWQKMGGAQVFKSYASDGKVLFFSHGKQRAADIELRVPEPHLQFLENLPQWFVDDTLPFVACHCGTHPGVFGIQGDLVREEESVFSADGWWESDKIRIPGKDIIFSHVPFPKPYVGKGKIGIDLGAGLGVGGKLCAMEMYSHSFHIVE
jgi:hypothetical protein